MAFLVTDNISKSTVSKDVKKTKTKLWLTKRELTAKPNFSQEK